MRLGFTLPQIGSIAGPDSIRRVAQRAEAVGYDSLWVADRLLYPVAPKTKYPGTASGKLPDGARRVLDPVGTLTYAAACTERIKLGSSVLVAPFYNPVLLGRELTTLDILSNGRLRVGFGTGWSADEYEAAGVDMATRGARKNELLDVLRALWAPGPSEYQGRFFSLPQSEVLKPVQERIPIYLAAYTPAAMKRVAERADGWNPAGLPIEVMKMRFEGIQAQAQAAGRDRHAIELIVRANIVVTDSPLPSSRHTFSGSMAQLREDILATREIGAHELIVAPSFAWSGSALDAHLEFLEAVQELLR